MRRSCRPGLEGTDISTERRLRGGALGHINARMESARFFEDSVVRRADANGDLRMDTLPDGRTRIALLMTKNQNCTGVWIVGPRTSAIFKTSHGVERAVVATIKPGWTSTLLGVPASELTDQTLRLQTLWGDDALSLTCEVSRAPDSLPERFVAAALKRNREESSSARLARHATRLLETEPLPVETVAEKLGVTSRHLRRTFVENVGVGPKEYARASRLQRALRLSEKTDD